jgi:CTP synthase
VEVGGTVGDLENSYFIEAMRELRHEEGRENVCFVNVTYIIEPCSLGEFKSKPAQLGIRKLMELGVQPDVIVCRSENPIPESIKEKVSIYSNVPVNRIYNLWDMKNVYEIPLLLRNMGMDNVIFGILKTEPKKNVDTELNFSSWEKFVERIKEVKRGITIGIVGKYTDVHDSYLSILKALEHTGPYYGVKVNVKWVESTNIEDEKIKVDEALKGIDGIIVPGGFGKRGVEGKIMTIRYVREHKIPFLGLCFGMQLAVVEFARNVCKMKGANTTEVDPKTPYPVIDFIPEQVKLVGESRYGATMRLGSYPAVLKKGTLIRKLYGKDEVLERHRHRYEVNPKYVDILEKNELVFSGKSPDSILMEFLELPNHPCFIATQAHPEFKSRPMKPSPMFNGLIKACIENK